MCDNKEDKEYEMHARSNESLRDKMDGVLEENHNVRSCECETSSEGKHCGIYASGCCKNQ